MAYLDEKGLKRLGLKIAKKIKDISPQKENVFTDSYCKSSCDAYLKNDYTTDNFPFKYHINDNQNIYIDGISDAGLSDESFDKLNIVINSKYTINGVEYAVTGIGDYGFAILDDTDKSEEELEALFYCTSVTLPFTVIHLGDKCFAHDIASSTAYRTAPVYKQTGRHLTYLLGTDNVTEVTGTNTFAYCANLKQVYLPKLSTLVSGMFMRCAPGLESVCLGNVTIVPDSVFQRCYRLKQIRRVNDATFSITSIGTAAFDRTIDLKDFKIDLSKLKSVGEEAFLFSGYNADWTTTVDCTFGPKATKYQMWSKEILEHKFDLTPCLNTNGKDFGYCQRYLGWSDIQIGNNPERHYGPNGCSYMAVSSAYNIMTGNSITPVEYNALIANTSKEPDLANDALPTNFSSTDDLSIGCIVKKPQHRIDTIEQIQAIFDGLAQGNVYWCRLITKFVQGDSLVPAGAHAELLVGIDEDGKAIIADSGYGGMNYEKATCPLVHVDFFNWFSGKTYVYNGVESPLDFFNKIEYNPNYVD